MAEASSPEVRRDVLGGKCVAFVGSGLSKPPADTWKPTVMKIAEKCGIETAGLDLPAVIDACIEADLRTANTACRELFPRYTSVIRPALPLLLRLKFRAILTTNFDPYLRTHSQASDYKFHVYPD